VAESRRLEVLRDLGVLTFAPLVYAHKPGMAEWLTKWAMDFGSRVPGAVQTATIYPEPGVTEYWQTRWTLVPMRQMQRPGRRVRSSGRAA